MQSQERSGSTSINWMGYQLFYIALFVEYELTLKRAGDFTVIIAIVVVGSIPVSSIRLLVLHRLRRGFKFITESALHS